jgi:hypothetical protein
MPELFDFFDPSPEKQNVVLVNAATLRDAEKLSTRASAVILMVPKIPFDNILDPVPAQILA